MKIVIIRLGQVCDLPVFKGEVKSPYIPTKIKKIKIPTSVLEPPLNYKSYTHNRYTFFVPANLDRINQNDNMFIHYDNKKKVVAKVFVQVTIIMPLNK